MSLVRAGTMYGEVFGAMTEMKNEKEQQRDICAATNFHPYGGNYCDSDSPPYTVQNSYPVWFADPSMFVNLAIMLIFVAVTWENPDSCYWMYPKKAFDDGNNLPIFLILSYEICSSKIRLSQKEYPDR